MKCKTRMILLALAVLLVLPVACGSLLSLRVSAATVTVTASAVNVPRGEGQLIVYTPSFGATTNTNEWGSEAVVGSDNRVVSVGSNNSAIPAGGFVLSGHDTDAGNGMKTWINNNVSEGKYVYFNDRTLQITVSDEPLNLTEEVFYDLTVTATAIDAARYENYLVVYRPSFGATTNTNAYGFEVVVEDGLVTALGGNNSAIPKNGFVVSGHGTMVDWLKENVMLGMSASFNASLMEVKFVYNADSLLRGLNVALLALQASVEQAKTEFLYMDYDAFATEYAAVQKLLDDAKTAYSKKEMTDAELAVAGSEVNSRIEVLQLSITESRTVQYRAVWVRPSQRNAAEVLEYVRTLHEAGINAVFIEGSYDNTVIMTPPKNSLFRHNSNFSYDVLQAYVDACHQYNMECHLWMAIYLNGYSGASNYRSSVVAQKPEWISLDQNGKTTNEYNFVMIDPANQEAKQYLLEFYEYLLWNYDIDGFQLDYIRYYDRTDTADYGYTQAAFDAFEQKYHYGVKPTYDMEANYWNDWVQFRKDCITDLVRSVRELIDRTRPDVLLSADVVPRPDLAGVRNYQDYLTWQKNHWLDVLHPMAYGDGFGDSILQQIEIGGDRCMVAVGLGAYMDSVGALQMTRQAMEDTQYDAYGDAYFEASAFLKANAAPLLKQTVYRNQALAPFLDRDASLKACLEYMQGRIADVLLPLNGLTEEEHTALSAAITAAMDSVADARIGGSELQELRDAIQSVSNVQAKKVLSADLLRAERISCTTYKVGRDQLTETLSRPQDGERPPMPDDSEDPDNSEDPSATEDSSSVSQVESTPVKTEGGFPDWAFIVIGVAAVAIIVVVAVLVVRKK